jgi:ATP-dependent protease ClpP protease subunit
MNAQQSKEYGLVDEVVGSRANAAISAENKSK